MWSVWPCSCQPCMSRCNTGHRRNSRYGSTPRTCAQCSVRRKNAAMARNASKTSPLGDHAQLCFWDGSLVVIGFSCMVASYTAQPCLSDRLGLIRVVEAALYDTSTFSKHHAMPMRLTDGRGSFPAKGHNISPVQQCSPWHPRLPSKLSMAFIQTSCPIT